MTDELAACDACGRHPEASAFWTSDERPLCVDCAVLAVWGPVPDVPPAPLRVAAISRGSYAPRCVPAPLSFPARQDSPEPAPALPPDVAGAWGDLRGALDGLKSTLDGVLAAAPTAAGLRTAADAAAVLAEAAAAVSRAIHDAFPDVVTPDGAACPGCIAAGWCGDC